MKKSQTALAISELEPQNLKYIRRTHVPKKGQPMCIEVLETESKLYSSCYDEYVHRFRNYPHVYYLFLTLNRPGQVDAFASKYRQLDLIFDYARFTPALQLRLKTASYPCTFLVNDHLELVHKGELSGSSQVILSKLNVLASNCYEPAYMSPAWRSSPVSNRNL